MNSGNNPGGNDNSVLPQAGTGGMTSSALNKDWGYLEDMLNETENEESRQQSPLRFHSPERQGNQNPNGKYEPLLSPFNGATSRGSPRVKVFAKTLQGGFPGLNGGQSPVRLSPTVGMFSSTDQNFRTVKALRSPERSEEYYNVNNLEKENYILKNANSQLLSKIEGLNDQIRDYRTQPTQISMTISDSLNTKMSKLEGEVQRLKTQVQGKNDIIEELKMKLKNAKKENFDTENLTSMLREELRIELEEKNLPILASYKERAIKSEQEYDLVKIELDSKIKELELAEQKIDEIADKEIDKIEEVKRSIRDKLWGEYEKKLTIKQEEFEKRLANSLDEIANLNDTLTDWRNQCADLEEKNAKLIDDLNILGRDEVNKRHMITEYETIKGDLEIEIEKLKTENDNLSDQLVGRNDKIKSLEAQLLKMEDKNHRIDDENMELKSKFLVLNKEIDQRKREVEIWKRNTGKLENSIANKNMELNELKKELSLNSFEKDNFGEELNMEKKENDHLALQNFKLESTNQMQDDMRTALEMELRKAKNQAENLSDQLELANQSARRWKEEYDRLQKEFDQTNMKFKDGAGKLDAVTGSLEEKIMSHEELAKKYQELCIEFEGLAQREFEVNRQLKSAELEISLLNQKNKERNDNIEGTNQKVLKYKNKYNQLRTETRKLLDTNKYLREQVKKSQDIIDQHKNEYATERQKVGSLINDISSLQAHNNQLVNQFNVNNQIIEENNLLKQDNQQIAAESQEMHARLREYETKMDQMISEINEKNKIRTELEVVTAELNSREHEMVRASLDVKQSTAQTEVLQNKLNEVQDELINLRMIRDEEFASSTENIRRLENEVETLSIENQNLKQTVDGLNLELLKIQERSEQTINRLNENIHIMQNENQSTINHMSDDIRKLQEMKDRELTEKEQALLNQNQANVERMKENMTTIQTQNQETIKRLVEGMKNLEVKNLQMSGQVTDFRGKYEISNAQLNQANKSIELMKLQIDGLVREKSQLQNSHSSLLIAKGEIDMLKKSLAVKETMVTNMSFEIRTLKEQVMAVQKQLNFEIANKSKEIHATRQAEMTNANSQIAALNLEIQDLKQVNIQNIAMINRIQREKGELEANYLNIINQHEGRLKEIQDLQRVLHQKDSQMQMQLMNRAPGMSIGADINRIRNLEESSNRANQLIQELRNETRRLRAECLKHQDAVKEWQSKYFYLLKEGTLDNDKIKSKMEVLNSEMERLGRENFAKEKQITDLKERIIDQIQGAPGAGGL